MLHNVRFVSKPHTFRNPKITHLLTQDHMELLGNRHFLATIFLAILLHIFAFFVWHIMPKEHVMNIPVRALNIKLGDGDAELTPDEMAAIQPKADNHASVEQTISRMVRDPKADAARSDAMAKTFDKAVGNKPVQKPIPAPKFKEKPFDMRSEGVAVAAPVMAVTAQQFVRDLPPSSAPAQNSGEKTPAEVRYEQTVSAWIAKFKPDRLLVSSQPDRLTSMIRIRIDRRGNIRFMELDKSSGFLVLDRAALDTVRRANPVPAVPQDYPSGDYIEFIVPVVFTQ